MSYSRFGYADVYVYMDCNGTLACCGCILNETSQYFTSTEAMIDHLAEHRVAGHDVPDYIEDDLRKDDEENFPPSCRDGHAWGEPYQPYPDRLPSIKRRDCTRCGWVD